MIHQIATDRSQSERLINAGVDPNTADMIWQVPITLSAKYNELYNLIVRKNSELWNTDIPAWSLPVLIGMLPSPIYAENHKQFTLRIIPTSNGEAWVCDYDGHHTTIYQTNGKSAVEAVVRMIEKLTQDQRKLNEI